MSRVVGALRLPHLLGIGLVVAVLGGGIPSNWFGLASSKITEVERLQSCMARHKVELATLVTSLGDPHSLLAKTPRQRAHEVRAAERRGRLQRREAHAIEACARTVAR
ncbi:MAG TPA: hypothetical protein VFW29_11580 [Solirubrobacteraceae bacterium]|nr:hypothetical protein [Solirubrobacteraceae bacterium]